MQGVEPGYRAFISYSHSDEGAARRIHRGIESYRLPRRLMADGAPRRLTPIFRDRDELAASGNLSQTIKDALARSDALIVLCSPAAQASLWVAREIEAFRELHPDRPILAALVAGEPMDAFPAALLSRGGTEPIAADFRKQGDGARLARLKLVAGLTGVGLDALVQRDAQRQIRRVTAITLGAVAAMVIMALLLVLAVNARREAEHQRTEAEGLVEFMLTDLRTRLRGVGRLDVMEAVNARAIGYYNKQVGALPDESLERRARILHAMSEDDESLGHYDRALDLVREAHASTATLLMRHPEDPRAIFTHAQSDFWLGRIYVRRGEWRDARRQYELYDSAGRRLVSIEPNNPAYMMERAWGSQNLGALLLNGFEDFDGAERKLREAIIWFGRARQSAPDWHAVDEALSETYAWLGDSYYKSMHWRESLNARRRQLEIEAALLSADQKSAARAYALAGAERAVAQLEGKLGNWPESRRLFTMAYDRMLALAHRDSANADWLIQKTKTECQWLAMPRAWNSAIAPDLLKARIRKSLKSLRKSCNPRKTELDSCFKRNLPLEEIKC